MRVSELLAIGIALLAVPAVAQNQTGGITGVVTDAVTHLPIKKTTVLCMPVSAGQPVTTDASGAFSIGNLAAGKYQLTFQNRNYPEPLGKSVEVKAGETTGPVKAELMPGAAVSGRIVDEDGDPLSHCNVEIHRAGIPDQGVAMLGMSVSDEDGAYRGYGIGPGKYLLTAHCGQPVFQARPLSVGPDPLPSRAYPPVQAPQVVELTGGAEKTGVDFQMNPAAVTQVRGVFSPGGADWHGPIPLQVQLIPLDRRGIGESSTNFDQAKGTFEFRQVFPGSYMLAAFSNGPEETRIGASQRVEVSDRPVALAVELRHAIDLSGKVEIESGGNGNQVALSRVRVWLTPQPQMNLPGPSQAQVDEDGTFTLKGVVPGAWRVQANAPSAYLKAAWLGSTDVTNSPMDLSGGAAGALRLVVSTNTATIRGSAPAGQMIQLRADDRGIGGGQADQSGQYQFNGLAPGKYRVMLMSPGGAVREDGSQEVTVREGATATVDLKGQ